MFVIFVKKQSQELVRVNPDRNSINVELTSTFLLSTAVWSITITEFKKKPDTKPNTVSNQVKSNQNQSHKTNPDKTKLNQKRSDQI